MACSECDRDMRRIRRGLCDACYRRWYLSNPDRPDCSVADCADLVVSGGLCNKHYLRRCRNGHTDLVRVVRDGCAVDTCDRDHFGRGYCAGHYARLMNYGDLRVDVPLRSLRAGVGYINAKGYKVTGAGILEHRETMADIIGRPLHPDEQVHHKNTVRHDNRPENLELWVGSHPSGARAEDIVVYAVEMLRRYAPELLDATLAQPAA